MKKTCKTCIFWNAYSDKWGWCKKANKDIKSGFKCVEYEYKKEVLIWKRKFQ